METFYWMIVATSKGKPQGPVCVEGRVLLFKDEVTGLIHCKSLKERQPDLELKTVQCVVFDDAHLTAFKQRTDLLMSEADLEVRQ